MMAFTKHDFMKICNWMNERGIKAPPFEELPPTGLIVDNIACGFLITTDNGYGILDYFLSNPSMPLRARAQAIDEIAGLLIEKAKLLNLRKLKCDTKIRSIHRQALKHGFQTTGLYSSLMREI